MTWLVSGASGQLGSELALLLRRQGYAVLTPTRRDLDLGEPNSFSLANYVARPEVVLNCAAWTNVDGAESAEAEVIRINASGPAEIAKALRSSNRGLMVQISTDYVFGGSSIGPHAEYSTPAPESVYGRSKLAGEVAVRLELVDRSMIVRTAWLYGAHGSNFVKTIARKALAGQSLKVVNDQLGQPSWTVDVASRILGLVDGFQRGIVPAGTYHAVNAGSATWFEFAQEIVRLLNQDPELVTPISSNQLSRAAKRPVDSRLGDAAAQACGLPPMRDWREALAEALPQIIRSL